MIEQKDFKPNVAFFDSSQGGLTVLENVLKNFPELNIQYLGDNARCPYGNKSNDTIIHYASEAALYLTNRNANLLVVACGTVSAVAVKRLQKIFKIPVIGIVEGFCQYVSEILQDKKRTVVVLGTRFSIRSQRFNEELSLYDINKVWAKACPLFVPLVEEGISSGPMVDAAADIYFSDIPEDTKIVMLACTHYPRLALPIAEAIERQLGRTVIYKTLEGDKILKRGSVREDDPIYLVESSYAIVSSVQDFLTENNLFDTLNQGEKHILCTDSPAQFESIARFFATIELPKPQAVEIQP